MSGVSGVSGVSGIDRFPSSVVTEPVVLAPPLRQAASFSTFPKAKALTVIADGLALSVAMVLASRLNWILPEAPISRPYHHLVMGVLSLPIWLALFSRYHLYTARRITSRLQEFGAVVHAMVTGVVTTAAASFMLRVPVSRAWLILCLAFGVLAAQCERELVRRSFTALRRRGRLLRRVVVVGTNVEALALAAMLGRNRSLGYEVVGLVAVDDLEDNGGEAVPALGTLHELPQVLAANDAGGVLIATTALDSGTSDRLARQLTEAGIHVELALPLRDMRSDRLTVRALGAFPVVYVEPTRRGGWRAGAKHAFDVVVAATVLLVLCPLLLLIAALITLDSPGPVLFRQERVGKDGRLFSVLKFRTMVVGAERLLGEVRHLNEADGPLFKIERDPRITRIGATLRTWSLDELPQLWNVLRGEMSIVGPRPALPSEVHSWSADVYQRLRVKPGVTGMWQVHGRAAVSFEKYNRLDLFYVDNWTLLTDLAIVAKTIPAVLRRTGSY